MREVEYKTNGGNCLTLCPFGRFEYLSTDEVFELYAGSVRCKKQCKHFVSDNPQKEVLICNHL